MTLLVARWEWRAFACEFGQAEARIRSVAFEAGALDETYLLARSEKVIARIRHGQLEARRLVETRPDGLELWRTEIKTSLPLFPPRIIELFRLWGMPAPSLTRSEYTLDHFRADVLLPQPHVHTVDVVGARFRGSINGGMVEFGELQAGGLPLHMVAIEAGETGTVRRTVEELGLATQEPRNYLKALRAVWAAQPH